MSFEGRRQAYLPAFAFVDLRHRLFSVGMVAGIAGSLLVRLHDEAITRATSIPTAKSKIKYPVLLTYATAGRGSLLAQQCMAGRRFCRLTQAEYPTQLERPPLLGDTAQI
jgi:hypothetical protein